METEILLPGATGSDTCGRGHRDELVPRGVGRLAARVDVLLGAGLDQRLVRDARTTTRRQPPPMPTHVAEDSASPALACVAVGTVQVPVMDVKRVPLSSAPSVVARPVVGLRHVERGVRSHQLQQAYPMLRSTSGRSRSRRRGRSPESNRRQRRRTERHPLHCSHVPLPRGSIRHQRGRGGQVTQPLPGRPRLVPA